MPTAPMKTAQQWFALYGESHRHPTNKAIHWVCVPLILCTSLGMIQSIPHPLPAPLHWGWVAALGMLGFYATLSRTLLLGMAGILAASLVVNHLLASAVPLFWVSAGVWMAAWLAQFVGHEIEGKKPSFFQDVQYLLVGPAWLLHFVYQRVGVPVGGGVS